MNTTTKSILGITIATTVVAVLGISVEPEQRTFLLMKIKGGTKDLINNFSSLITKRNAFPIESGKKVYHSSGEMTSELIDIDQYETYSSKNEL